MTTTIEEVRVWGVPVSNGVAIGTLYVLRENEEYKIPHFSIDATQVLEEISRYKRALDCSRKELEKLIECLEEEGAQEAVSILSTHLTMLDDPMLTESVQEKISSTLRNTESVFFEEMESYKKLFLGSGDPDVQGRFQDVKDLFTRVLRHLLPSAALSDDDIPTHSIVCTPEVVPSQTVQASPNQIRAFITEFGGPTSHAALIAKAKGLPYISNVDIALLEKFENCPTIVDGYQGVVIINPSEESLEEYSELKATKFAQVCPMANEMAEEDLTVDGHQIEVQANLEDLHDLHLLKEYKTKTIGLIRSEFLYLKKDVEDFCEEEQFQLYKKLMQLAGNMEVTFRIFDIGSDKQVLKEKIYEPNPALGCRSIRFLMSHPKIFTTQIRSVLRAANYGNMRLLLPLISDIHELREVKARIEDIKHDLHSEGVSFKKDIKIGCMVEVPAFVIMCDEIVKECDFLSIGTNDLTQYSFAADRSNPQTCGLISHDHPALVRMIKRVVEEGEKAGVDVSICGEIASDPQFTELLVGLGVKKLSCAPRFIPLIKEAIKSVDFKRAQKKANESFGF